MEVRDPIHGSITIEDCEIPIIEHPFFQRLRNIKQLGVSDYVFPGATHTRYLHSIGVMKTVSTAFDRLFLDKLPKSDFLRLKQTTKLAGLLHDIGHAPLSHSTESVMPLVGELKLPTHYCSNPKRQATHEDYTLKAIVDSDFTGSLRSSKKKYGTEPEAIADLVVGAPSDPSYFTVEGINYFPILSQLISGEMDCDRMDYLLRDSYFCGVSYGKFDLDWIIDNLDTAVIDNNAYLALTERAVRTFDDFLLSRFHMFMMVYFHYRAVCLEQMLFRYFRESKGEYTIPSSIDEYVRHDDHYLLKILKTSSNPWAQRITNNQIPPKIYEGFGKEDKQTSLKLLDFLKSRNIDYISCESNGRLSKYYSAELKQKPSFQIKVLKKYKNEYINIDEATELYKQFSQSHGVCRVHTYTDQITQEDLKKIHAMIS